MGMEKAIASGKEHRKEYRGAKAIDATCRNRGSCKYCELNRLYQRRKAEQGMNEREKEHDVWN